MEAWKLAVTKSEEDNKSFQDDINGTEQAPLAYTDPGSITIITTIRNSQALDRLEFQKREARGDFKRLPGITVDSSDPQWADVLKDVWYRRRVVEGVDPKTMFTSKSKGKKNKGKRGDPDGEGPPGGEGGQEEAPESEELPQACKHRCPKICEAERGYLDPACKDCVECVKDLSPGEPWDPGGTSEGGESAERFETEQASETVPDMGENQWAQVDGNEKPGGDAGGDAVNPWGAQVEDDSTKKEL